MAKIRYHVATSLDGYVAGPNGEADWIVMDPEVDFSALYSQFDTVLLGRRTFEVMLQAGNTKMPGMKMFVFSRTLQQSKHPEVTIVAEKQTELYHRCARNPARMFGYSEAARFSAACSPQDLSTPSRLQ